MSAVRPYENEETEIQKSFTTSTRRKTSRHCHVMNWVLEGGKESQGRLSKTHSERTLKRWKLPGEEPGGLIVARHDGENFLSNVPAAMSVSKV